MVGRHCIVVSVEKCREHVEDPWIRLVESGRSQIGGSEARGTADAIPRFAEVLIPHQERCKICMPREDATIKEPKCFELQPDATSHRATAASPLTKFNFTHRPTPATASILISRTPT